MTEILEVSTDDLLKSEDSFVQINTENTTTDGAIGGNVVQNQTINYQLSEKLIEQFEIRIMGYIEEIAFLKEKIKKLESK